MSKELKALERVKNFMSNNAVHWKQDIGYIETALKDYEMEHTLRIRLENINYELVRENQENNKKLKALEIIKDKEPSIMRIRLTKNSKHYNAIMPDWRQLTKEEFNILKEVFKNESN